MMALVLLAALALLLVPLIVSIRRSTELFVVKVRGGKAQLSRGRIPQRLLDDIGDVVKAPPVSAATLRVVRRSGLPSLSIRGEIHPDQQQRLRNVIHRFGVTRIAAGGRRKR